MKEGELLIDVLNGFYVLRQQLEALEGRILVLRRQPQTDVEWIEELQSNAFLLIQRLQQIVFHRTKAALCPQLLVGLCRLSIGGTSFEGQPGRYRKQLGRLVQQACGVLTHITEDLCSVLGSGQNVDLVYNEDDLFAPLSNLLQKFALALRKRAIR